MSASKVLILYYSGGGNTQKMAQAIADAMKSDILEISLEEIGRFDPSLLPDYDGIVLGSPTYFSNMAWPVKKVIDESIIHYGDKRLRHKVAGIFTSAGSEKDGQECLKMLEVALGVHHQMRVMASLLRVDGESDRDVQRKCQDFGRQLVEEIRRHERAG